jgi:glycosyltransferase involved in cell wall biosynthesis
VTTLTAVVPTLNEASHIAGCLESLIEQQGIGEDFEIVVVDGGSTDGTCDIVRAFPGFGGRIRLLDNPDRYQVYAWNIGWRAARGEYIAGVVAHVKYDAHYLRAGLDVLARTGADVVGPVAVAYGRGLFGGAVAWCMSSPFGVGNARFRYTTVEEEVDSVCNVIMRRDWFVRLGGYDERVPFDEDDELNYRLRRAGGRILVSPELRIRYHVRQTVVALARQMFSYGYWRRFTRILHPARVPARIYAPPALVAGLAVSLALAATPLWRLAPIVPGLYAAFVAVAAVVACRTIGPLRAAFVPCALATMHLSYGAGFFRALMTPAWRVLGGTESRDGGR